MTSNEIAIRQPAGEVDSWADVMPNVIKLSDHIANTEFVPSGLRGKPAAVAAAVLAGREQGIGPMTSLTHMHVVEGRPTMSAELKRARVLAAGHEIEFAEMTTTRCVVRGRRRGSENWTTVTWTMDDAKRAKLSGKTNWQNHPRRMLQARATSELCDLLFPDVVGGLPTTEEARDEGGDYTDATAPAEEKPKRRTAQRRTAARPATARDVVAESSDNRLNAAPEAVDEPPLPGEDGYDNPTGQAETGEQVTKSQLTRIHAALTTCGVTDRAERLSAASTIVGRQLDSSTEMTKSEASTLIDTLTVCEEGDDPHGRLIELLTATRNAEDDVVDGEIVESGDPE